MLFVAVSVNSAWFSSSAAHRGRAGQALVLFIVPLMTGILMPVPGQSTAVLAALIVGGTSLILAGLLDAWVFLMAAGADRAT
jgi:hypothetical protein